MNSLKSAVFGLLAATGFSDAPLYAALPAAPVALHAAAAGADTRTIHIVSGTYGQNCGQPRGNSTHDLARQCDGRRTCSYVLRDAADRSAAACRRDFHAEWRCGPTELHAAFLSAGAQPADVLVLNCVKENGPGK